MAVEWYRDPAWTAEAAAEFERRLARARPGNRAPYLRIKALAVLGTGDAATAELLLRRVLDEHPDSFDVRMVHEHLADLCVAAGRVDEAEQRYRVILARWPDGNGTSGEVPVKLAELLLDRGATGADEAARLLDDARDDELVLTPTILRWAVARARAADARGDRETAARAARRATELLAVPHAAPLAPELAAWLNELAADAPPATGEPIERPPSAPSDDEWGRLASALADAGVAGAHDVGRFVSDTEWLEASRFDERAARPVLLALLPTLDDPNVVSAVAGHLRRPWARPSAFEPLRAAFERWAERDAPTGWALGDALGTAAGKGDGPALLALATDERYGIARQMIVSALARFERDPAVERALASLIEDPDVSLHAMGALRQVVGNGRALPRLRRVRDTHADPRVRSQAAAQIRKAERALAR